MLLFAVFVVGTALFSQCGPAVSPVTTTAIIEVESGGNPYAIGDNTTRKAHAPKSKAEAIALATILLAQGHNVDLGLMQVNSSHLTPLKLTPLELFDPCTNIKTGTAILASYFRLFDTIADKNEVLFRALSAYNTGSAWRGQGYINRILSAANAPYRVKLKGAHPARKKTMRPKTKPVKFPPTNSPLFFDPAD